MFRRRADIAIIDIKGAALVEHRIVHIEITWVSNHAGQGRGRGCFGATQTDLVFRGTRTAGKIPRNSAQADLIRCRRLPHANAAIAAGLMQARPSAEQIGKMTQFNQVFQNLTRCGVDIERYSLANLAAFDHHRRNCKIPQARIRRGPNIGLVDWLASHFPHRKHLPWTAGECNQRLQFSQINLVMQVVGGTAVGFLPLEIVCPLLLPEKIPHRIVRREHRSGVSHLLPHVRDHMAVHRGQPFQAWPVILDNVPGTALHPVAAKHF